MRYRYRTDDELKDSGVEWIGKIPKDWEVIKLRNIGNISTSSVDKKINKDEKIVNLVNYVDVYNSKTKELFNNNEYMKVSAKETQILVSNLLKGDVLFTPSSETVHDIGYSAVVMEDLENTLYSYHLIRLRFNKEIYLNFKKYMFWSNSFLNYLSSRATGTTRKTLSISNFKDNIVTIPNIKEQEKIANFLDEKTSQFDFIIYKKEELIKKLEEAKKSLISEVVTGKVKVVKTDDGYEIVKRKRDEMKDSGVEWLGEIPKDWEVKKIKHVISEPLKYGANESAELENREFPRYIRITDFKDNGELKEDTFKSLPFEKAKDYLIKEGDILFARSGGTVGKTFLFKNYDGSACFAGYLIKATPNINKVKSEFLYAFTKSKGYENWKNSIFMQATIQNIGADKYKELKFSIPSITEQNKICEYLKYKQYNFNKLIKMVNYQIEKLKEAKQSLISEAVTGKIEILD